MKQVLVSGCFNILHPGHIDLLAYANSLGRVHVGLNGSRYVEKKCGSYAVPLVDRIKVVEACKYVHTVWVFDEEEPSGLIRFLRPDYYVRGPDYKDKALPESNALKEVGAKLMIYDGLKCYDSSYLVRGLGREETVVHL